MTDDNTPEGYISLPDAAAREKAAHTRGSNEENARCMKIIEGLQSKVERLGGDVKHAAGWAHAVALRNHSLDQKLKSMDINPEKIDIPALVEKVEQANQRAEATGQLLNTAYSERDEAYDQVSDLTTRLDTSEGKVQSQTEAMKKVVGERDKAYDQIEAREADLKASEGMVQAQTAALQKTTGELEQRTTELEAAEFTIQGQTEALKHTTEALDEKTRKLHEAEGMIGSQTKALKTATEGLEAAKTRLESCDTTIKDQADELKRYDTELKATKDLLQASQKEASDYLSGINILKGSLDTLMSSFETYKQEYKVTEEFKQKYDTVKVNLHKLGEAFRKYRESTDKKIAALDEKRKEHYAEAERFRKERDHIQKQFDIFETETVADLEDLREHAANLEESLKILQDEFNTLEERTSDYDTLQENNVHLERENTSLKKNIRHRDETIAEQSEYIGNLHESSRQSLDNMLYLVQEMSEYINLIENTFTTTIEGRDKIIEGFRAFISYLEEKSQPLAAAQAPEITGTWQSHYNASVRATRDGDIDAAYQHLKNAFSIQRNTKIMADLSGAALRLGNLDEAENYALEVLNSKKANQKDVAIATRNLATIYSRPSYEHKQMPLILPRPAGVWSTTVQAN